MEVQDSNLKMCRLNEEQISTKLNFIENYISASNAATASIFDSNANVTNKNVGTLMAEMNKDIRIQIKRALVSKYMKKEFDGSLVDTFIKQLEDHLIYVHDETATVLPYCAAITIYPYIESGLKLLGGDSKAPRHLSSYNGGMINLIFAISSQLAGAIAVPEYLFYFDLFAKLDYGDNYLEEHENIIRQELQQVIYAINQPASARGYQSCFFNLSIFDKYYYKALFEHLKAPGAVAKIKPEWDSLNKLQQYFLKWFNEERTKAVLTFPVVTVAMLHNNEEILDKEYETFVSKEISKGNAFFIYLSDTVDSLSSCCRLRNDISDQINDFQYSLGAGGIQTGSINVITLNVNRFVQDFKNKFDHDFDKVDTQYMNYYFLPYLLNALKKQIELMHKYQVGYRRLFEDLIDKHMMPIYDAHFININKQYCTIGLNGIVEAAEFLGYKCDYNSDYISFVSDLFNEISQTNKEGYKKYNIKFNTETVPAEALGIKFANWDKKDGYEVPRDCYNSYLFPVEDNTISPIAKFYIHGKETTSKLDGGSALHLSLEEYPTPETFRKLLGVAVRAGCPYFCTNVKVTICNECSYINKHTKQYCTKCGSKNVDYATRIIGYLKRISSFSKDRQIEESKRYYHSGI